MAIAPNTIIRIYTGLPLDNTYNHTLWFDTVNAQLTYFSSTNATFNLTAQSYQRVADNKIRIQKPINALYDCNYVAFQNNSYGSKWFYAFITAIEYINDVTSEITFQIDVMQTYLFDVDLLDCFVEREHSATDEIGDNIIDEGFNITEYFTDGDQDTDTFDNYTVVMLTPYKHTAGGWQIEYNPRLITHNPMLMNNIVYKGNNILEALEWCARDIINLRDIGHDDEIVSIYLVPTGMLDNAVPLEQDTSGHRFSLPQEVVTKEISFGSPFVTLGSYGRPRNKKLLTSPYSKFCITTFADSHDYAYEYFDTSDGSPIKFRIYGNLNPNSSFKIVPLNYKGDSTNFDEGVILTDFPLVPYNSDNFAAWLSRNKTRLCMQGIGTAFGAMGGIAKGNAMIETGSEWYTPSGQWSKKGAKMVAEGREQIIKSGTINPLKDVTSILGEVIGATELGVTPQGSTDGSLEIAMVKKDFNYLHKFINPKLAEVIDDYFDMFGYATKRVKRPNRNVRKHWTYVKTVGCIVKGKAPQQYIHEICGIYDNGITFWKKASEVGLYTQYRSDNKPL